MTAYLRVLRDARPKAFLLENVYGLAYKGKSEGLERILAGIDQINRETGTIYRPAWQVIDAASYGVPQHRERVFIVASRDGKVFKFPKVTHGAPDDLLLGADIEPYRTAWDALGDLPERPNDPSLRMTGKWAELLASIPEGENYLWHTPRGGGLLSSDIRNCPFGDTEKCPRLISPFSAWSPTQRSSAEDRCVASP